LAENVFICSNPLPRPGRPFEAWRLRLYHSGNLQALTGRKIDPAQFLTVVAQRVKRDIQKICS
jgi:hypothetical protein